MPYATLDDVRELHGSTVDQLIRGKVDTFTAHQAAVDAEIDATLAGRYAIPLPPGETWPILRTIAAALIYRRLYTSPIEDPAVHAIASMARKDLRDLANGKLQLVSTTGVSPDVIGHAKPTRVAVRLTQQEQYLESLF